MEGKTVIKPEAYTVNNVSNIGTLSHVSGPNWKGVNIRLHEIRTMLSEATYEIESLCISNNINKWAAFKPNGIIGSGTQVEQHGMFPDDGTMPFDWSYSIPDNTSKFRLDEFLGYNHSASAPGFNNLEVQDSLDTIKNSWTTDIGEVTWEDANTTHKIKTRILLPEWDIVGFSQNVGGTDYSISHARIIPFLKNSDNINPGVDTPISIGAVEITNSILQEKAIDLEFSFTPIKGTDGDGIEWAKQEGVTGGENIKVFFLIRYYLDTNRILDWSLDTPYANFPSNAGGTVEVTGNLVYRYYWDYKEYTWERATVEEGESSIISGTGRVTVKIDRSDSSIEIIKETAVHYETTENESPTLDSNNEQYAFKVVYDDGSIWAEPYWANEWYFFEDGKVGDAAGDI